MRNLLHFCFYFFSTLLLFPVTAHASDACMLVPVSLQQRTDASSLIIEGKVVSQSSFWDAAHKTIYTSSRVQVLKYFRGNAGNTIDIITEGGTVGNDMIVHTATLQLYPGQYGIFFCNKAQPSVREGAYMVYGSLQGFIRYDLATNTASAPFDAYPSIASSRASVVKMTNASYRVVAADDVLTAAERPRPAYKTTATPSITSFIPSSTPGGIETLLTITGTNFGTTQGTGYVEFLNANDGGSSYVRPSAPHYVSWNNTTIVLRVPSNAVTPSGCAGTGNFRVTNSDPATGTSPSVLTIPFAYTNFESGGIVYRADLVNDNGSGGYTFQYYTGFAANAPATAAFVRAMDSWCATQMNWSVSVTNTAVNTIASDGVNVVRFDIGAELPVGVLGRLTSYYSGCGPSGGPFDWYVAEMDIVFDDGVTWEYGPALPSFTEYDFESVAVHELGHGHQLNHVIDATDVMHYAIGNGQVKRIPGTDDITGGTYVAASSLVPNACGPSPMVLDPCALPVELLSFSGRHIQQGVQLTWSVVEDSDINEYDIARSTDGKLFTVMGSVAALLNGTHNYTFIDPDRFSLVFYKLLIKKKDGSTTPSATIRITDGSAAGVVSVYPNPMTTALNIAADGDLLMDAVFTLVTADGRLVKERSFTRASGMSNLSVPVADLPSGIYFYKVETTVGIFTGKLLKP